MESARATHNVPLKMLNLAGEISDKECQKARQKQGKGDGGRIPKPIPAVTKERARW